MSTSSAPDLTAPHLEVELDKQAYTWSVAIRGTEGVRRWTQLAKSDAWRIISAFMRTVDEDAPPCDEFTALVLDECSSCHRRAAAHYDYAGQGHT